VPAVKSATRSPFIRFLSVLGPGLITGAADDDPSGVATYAQAGATFQNGLLWTVPVTLPLMMAAQEICDRMVLATGDSLGKLIREKFTHRWQILIGILLALLVIANILNSGADLMAIGQGMHLLHAGPAVLWSAVAGVAITVAVVFGSFATIGKIFKWLCLVLLVYVVVLVVAHLNWADVALGLVGGHFRLTPAYFGLIVAVLGTSISPYMFFWQSAERIEELREEELGGKKAPRLDARTAAKAKQKLKNARIDVFTGMTFSVIIMFAIIAATAATLGAHHKTVSSAAQAAQALAPVAGSYASIIFAIGFIGSGVLAVPVLAASGAAGMAGLLGKEWGFDRKVRRAPLFYGILVAGIILGAVLSMVSSNPIQLLVLSAVVNGIAAGPFLIIIMLIARDTKIMGTYVNGALANTMGWIVTVVMCIAGAYGIWYTIFGQ
jgi:NRAMP (natural resistance-associated macrophage protein)-like metal ion transporter